MLLLVKNVKWSSWNFWLLNMKIYYRNWSTFCRPIPFSSFLYTNCFYSSCISLPSSSLHWASCLSHEKPRLCYWCLLPFNPRFVLILVYGKILTHTHTHKVLSDALVDWTEKLGNKVRVFTIIFNLPKEFRYRNLSPFFLEKKHTSVYIFHVALELSIRYSFLQKVYIGQYFLLQLPPLSLQAKPPYLQPFH